MSNLKSKPIFQLIAVDRNNKRVQIINEDSDQSYLERIVEARDGFAWVGSEPCSLEVVRA